MKPAFLRRKDAIRLMTTLLPSMGVAKQPDCKLQERYGWAKDKARKEIDEWFTSQGF
jgi:hypothetical protein